MVAYGTMQESEAFRNLCRAYGIPMDEFNEVGKDLDAYRDHPKWRDIIEESKKFIGVIDSVSPHPCANLLLTEPISEEIGIIKVGDVFCALIDSDTSDAWKYLKNDYLTVTVWRIISDTFKLIGKPIIDVRTLIKETKDDERIWSLYEKGLTATLNQTGTDSAIPQIMQYKPKSIRELSAWVSAIRPAFASMKHYFLNRIPFSYDIPEFDKILKESDNFILYQENIMATLIYAGFPEDQTYGLIKAIAKKKEGIIEPIRDKFINGFIERTGSVENAHKVWKIIEDAVGYGFNSSHAYAVALDSLYGAYLKANYPLEYYTIILNIYEDDTEMTAKIQRELDYFNIQLKPIQFGKSRGDYTFNREENTIYKGIASIKYLNKQVSDELYQLAQEKEYEDFVSLLIDIFEKTSVNARQMEILIKLDFFKDFGEKEALLEIYQVMADIKKPDKNLYPEFADTKKVPLKYDSKHKEATKLKRIENLKRFEQAVRNNPPEKIPLHEQILFEKDVLGYTVTTYDVPESICVVIDIDKRYSPKITLYQIKTGKEIVVKVDKKKFYMFETELLHIGDIIKVINVIQKPAMKKVDGKWVKDETRKDLWLEKCKIIKRAT